MGMLASIETLETLVLKTTVVNNGDLLDFIALKNLKTLKMVKCLKLTQDGINLYVKKRPIALKILTLDKIYTTTGTCTGGEEDLQVLYV
jgi:hypothetical protein